MNNLTIDQLYSHINRYFVQGRYAIALNLATVGANYFEPERCLLCLSPLLRGRPAGRTKIWLAPSWRRRLAAGYWYAEHVLRSTPSLRSLQGYPRL